MGSEQNTTEVSFRCPQISNSVTDNRTLHLLTLSQLCAKLRFLLSAPTMSLSRGLHQILVKLPACSVRTACWTETSSLHTFLTADRVGWDLCNFLEPTNNLTFTPTSCHFYQLCRGEKGASVSNLSLSQALFSVLASTISKYFSFQQSLNAFQARLSTVNNNRTTVNTSVVQTSSV